MQQTIDYAATRCCVLPLYLKSYWSQSAAYDRVCSNHKLLREVLSIDDLASVRLALIASMRSDVETIRVFGGLLFIGGVQ